MVQALETALSHAFPDRVLPARYHISISRVCSCTAPPPTTMFAVVCPYYSSYFEGIEIEGYRLGIVYI